LELSNGVELLTVRQAVPFPFLSDNMIIQDACHLRINPDLAPSPDAGTLGLEEPELQIHANFRLC
jgi:hypothetical protein